MRNTNLLAGILLGSKIVFYAQNTVKQDTIKLKEIQIQSYTVDKTFQKKEIMNNTILIGKNYEEIKMTEPSDKTNNNVRQSLAKVPGLSIWENDASGVQIGISTRGLSPNRSWEMNTRMNGYDIAADPYGYPEAYFNPPLDAVHSIQIIKGSSALAYGSQFGGVVNYVLKGEHINKDLEIESKQVIGQYNLYSTFNSIGGSIKKLKYYTYYNHKKTDTWRENNQLKYHNAYGKIDYQPTSKFNISLEYSYMNYLLQQPGGLTDSLFDINPKQSLRKRNWMNIEWNLIANTIQYKINNNHHLTLQNYYSYSQRNSIGFLQPINILDMPDSNGIYSNRQIDRDKYNNAGSELRYIWTSKIADKKNIFTAGYRFFKGSTERFQKGIGNNKKDYSLYLTRYYEKDFDLNTNANAVFVENAYFITPRIKIVPGARYEYIQSSANGYLNYFSNQIISVSRKRNILLLGGGAEWEYIPNHYFTINYTQNFRPVLYSELIPSATIDIIDENLKDIHGSISEVALQGTLLQKGLYYHFSAFYMEYKDKIGNIPVDGKNLRTNIGDAVNKGIELLIDAYIVRSLIQNKPFDINVYYSAIFQNFKYTKWNDPATFNTPKNIVGKSVEYAPDYIHRTGLRFLSKYVDISYQKQIYSDVFTDALNTDKPNKTATVGKIKGYTIDDATIYLKHKWVSLSITINNLFDIKYATRRASGYPGPGLIPGNGRNWLLSIGFKW